MNDFLVQAFMDASAQAAEGTRIKALVRAVAEHCAKMAETESPTVAEAIRQEFVYPTPTNTAVAAKLATLIPRKVS